MPIQIDRDEVARLVKQGAQLLDVLPSDEYEDEHLPGAINIPLEEMSGERLAGLRRDEPVITYCHDHQ